MNTPNEDYSHFTEGAKDKVSPSRDAYCSYDDMLLSERDMLKDDLSRTLAQVNRLWSDLTTADRALTAAHSNDIRDGFR